MAATKRSIAFPEDLWAEMERLGLTEPGELSASVAEGMRARVRQIKGLQSVAQWESTHGQLTDEEMAAARQRMTDARLQGQQTRSAVLAS